MSDRLFIVMLRPPRRDDSRTDPFWEFGSFGCTGCHKTNLLHPMNCQIADGDRLAFIQGGRLGCRLLLVTPPVIRMDHPGGDKPKGRVELLWDSRKKPFQYDRAPSLFESSSPRSRALFPRLAAYLNGTNRSTMDAKFASRFRARNHALEPELGSELEAGFKAALARASNSDFITHYAQALPRCDCPSTTSDRKRDYHQRLRDLRNPAGVAPRNRGCCK